MGREAETVAIERLIAGARQGVSGVLVLEGEAGIGKTTLLGRAESLGGGMEIARATGVEPEADVPYSGLHQLLLPFIDGLDRIPEPHADALRAAFGLATSASRDRFFVGMAALALLSDVAVRRPVLCLIDDAHQLDPASIDALGFAARRVIADRLVLIFTTHVDELVPVLPGLDRMRLGGLDGAAAVQLIDAVAACRVDDGVAARIAADSHGNPLVVIEVLRALSEAQLAGLAPLPELLPVGARLVDFFQARLRAFPAEAQTLFLLAAADPSGDAGLICRAAEHLGVERASIDLPPGADAFLSLSPRVRFSHALKRSAVYYAASAADRRRAHEALATACDPVTDPDHRAWHLAAAAVEPNEEIAHDLERAANRARCRGGAASAATFLERAAELTPDPSHRAARTLACAEARLLAGQPCAARSALNVARAGLVDARAQCDAMRLEGVIDFSLGRPDAVASLLTAAQMCVDFDVREARDVVLQAFDAAQITGSFSRVEIGDVLDVALTIRIDDASRTVGDDLLDGFATLVESGEAAGVQMLRQTLERLAPAGPVTGDQLKWLPAAWNTALELYDDRTWQTLTGRWTMAARMHGTAAALSIGLGRLAHFDVVVGHYAAAEHLAAEALDIGQATQTIVHPGGDTVAGLSSLAWRGREEEARAGAARVIPELTTAGRGLVIRVVQLAITVLELGLGNYHEALRAARKACPEGELSQLNATPELIEAAVRCGELGVARAALDRLSARAKACGTDWALGLMLRSEALLADRTNAEERYRAAIEHLGRTLVIPQLGRTHLLYGEWLRRQRRRRDAREELRTAFDILGDIGADAFAERARAELLATGEHARRRVAETLDQLTPQEEQVARLASEGASNMEIATQLFISVPTVGYHLQKAFRKLDVTNRTSLTRALAARSTARSDGVSPVPRGGPEARTPPPSRR